MPITIYPGSMKKRNANGSYSDLVPAIATDPEVLDDFAEEYSTSETYNIGDYCIHNSDLYKCNTNNTTGTWNSNVWDRVSVTDELVNHKNTLNLLETEAETVENSIAVVVDGDMPSAGATAGQYILLKNSTIAGRSDGLYTVASGKTVSQGTAIDGTYLNENAPISCGGLNAIKGLLPITASLVRITDNQAVDLNVVFSSSANRGIQLIWYTENSSYKPDTSSGLLLQYCWNTTTGMQIAFTGSGALFLRWNLGGIGVWTRINTGN